MSPAAGRPLNAVLDRPGLETPGYPRIARPGQKPGPLRGFQRCIRVRTGAIWRFTRDVIRTLEEHGWRIVATRGSHRQFKHPSKPGPVTVAGKPSDDLAAGTLNSIPKQAGLKREGGE